MGTFDYQKLPSGYPDQNLTEGLKKGLGFQANWHDVIYKRVKSKMENYDSHLDFACGPGIFIGKYTDGNSVGIDIAEPQIDYAINKYGDKGEFLVKDGNNIDFKENSFDIVTMLDFVEHIEDEEVISMLNEIYKFLKPGGKLIITTPNYNSLYRFLEMIVNIVGPVSYKDQHINKFHKKRLYTLLQQTKFTNIEVEKFLNFSCFFSVFSIKLAQKAENIVENIFSSFYGYVLLAVLHKQNN